MKQKTKQLLAAVHGNVLRIHAPCDYVEKPPSRNTCGMPVWGMNPKTGVEYEMECLISYEFYAGSGKSYSDDYDPPSVESLSVWHFREKIGMWHEIDISPDTEKYLCESIVDREMESIRDYQDQLKYEIERDREDYDREW